MDDTLSKFIIFTTGAALGSVVTWFVVKSRYEKIINDEIESVKEAFSRRDDICEDEETPVDKPNIDEYESINKQLGYKEATTVYKPQVIRPEEFGELEEYEINSLTYYSDGVLTDDQNEPIEDAESVVGCDFENHFGEYEDDSVFIRNDERKTYYEILSDQRTYEDVTNKNPHLAED